MSRPRSLCKSIAFALGSHPHVLAIEPYGAMRAETDDEYSDVDLRVQVNNLAAVVNARHALLNGVGPLALEWIIHARPDSFCSTVLFAAESCYHKVDIEFWSLKPAMYDESTSRARAIEGEPAVYVPAPGDPGHFLVGQLLGATRYAKARKRGQSLTCWRFVSAMVDWICALLHEQAHQWRDAGGKLTTEQYVALDATADLATVRRLLSALDLSSADKMDSAVMQLLDVMAALASCKGEYIGRPIPEAPISWLMRFLRTELAHKGVPA